MPFNFLSKESLIPLPREIVKSNKYPFARTLRTSFVEKLWDTFFVLAGKILVHEQAIPAHFPGLRFLDFLRAKKHRVGLLDVLTLFIPRLTLELFTLGIKYRDEQRIRFAQALLVLALIINIPLLVIRYLASAIITLLLSPVIIILSFVADKVGRQAYQDALKIESEGHITLEAYLDSNDVSLEDIHINAIETTLANSSDSTQTITLTFAKKYAQATEGEQPAESQATPSSFIVRLSKQSQQPTFSQANNVHALFSLNIGHVATTVAHEPAKLNLEPEAQQTLLAL